MKALRALIGIAILVLLTPLLSCVVTGLYPVVQPSQRGWNSHWSQSCPSCPTQSSLPWNMAKR